MMSLDNFETAEALKLSDINPYNLWHLIRLEMRVFFEEFNIYLGIAKTSGKLKFLDPILYPYKEFLLEQIKKMKNKIATGTFLIQPSPYLKKFVLFKVSEKLVYVLYSTKNDISNLVRITNKLNENRLIILQLISIFEEIREVLKPEKPFLFPFQHKLDNDARKFLKKKLDAMTNIFVENLKLKSLKRVIKYIEKLKVVAKNSEATLLYYILTKIEKHIKKRLDVFINAYINEERFNMFIEDKNQLMQSMLRIYHCELCHASFKDLIIADNLYYCRKCNHVSAIF